MPVEHKVIVFSIIQTNIKHKLIMAFELFIAIIRAPSPSPPCSLREAEIVEVLLSNE